MSEIKRELKYNQFIYTDEEFGETIVMVKSFATDEEDPIFFFGTVDGDSLKTLRTELHGKIILKVAEFKEKRDEILEARAEAERQVRLKKNIAIQLEFKLLLKNEVPELMALPHAFAKVSADRDPRRVTFYAEESMRGRGLPLKYSDRAYSRGAYSSHITDKVWVMSVDHRDRRYKKLKSVQRVVLKHFADTLAAKKFKRTQLAQFTDFCSAISLHHHERRIFNPYGRGRYSTRPVHYAQTTERQYGEGETHGEPIVQLMLSVQKAKISVTNVILTRKKPFTLFGHKTNKLEMQVSLDTTDEVNAFLAEVKAALGGNWYGNE